MGVKKSSVADQVFRTFDVRRCEDLSVFSAIPEGVDVNLAEMIHQIVLRRRISNPIPDSSARPTVAGSGTAACAFTCAAVSTVG